METFCGKITYLLNPLKRKSKVFDEQDYKGPNGAPQVVIHQGNAAGYQNKKPRIIRFNGLAGFSIHYYQLTIPNKRDLKHFWVTQLQTTN